MVKAVKIPKKESHSPIGPQDHDRSHLKLKPFWVARSFQIPKSLAFMVSECIQEPSRTVPFNPFKWRMWKTSTHVFTQLPNWSCFHSKQAVICLVFHYRLYVKFTSSATFGKTDAWAATNTFILTRHPDLKFLKVKAKLTWRTSLCPARAPSRLRTQCAGSGWTQHGGRRCRRSREGGEAGRGNREKSMPKCPCLGGMRQTTQ